MLNTHAIPYTGDSRLLGAVGTLAIQCENPHQVIADANQFAWISAKHRKVKLASDAEFAGRAHLMLDRLLADFLLGEDIILLREHNAYVASGLNNSLDREWALGGTGIGFIGVSSNTTAVTLATVFLNGASGGAAANTIIKAISPAATRSSQTTTGGATFQNADFTSGVFIWNKIGLLTTSTDAGTGLVDVIGGTGGVSPYNRTFSLDLTAAGTFTVVAQIADTASAA